MRKRWEGRMEIVLLFLRLCLSWERYKVARTYACVLTHRGRVTHIYADKLTISGSDNGLSPARCQAIIWTNVGILIIWNWGANFSEIVIEIRTFSFKKMSSENDGHFVSAPLSYYKAYSLQWCHNDHDSVSNHQPHGCLLNRLFGRRSKKTSKLRVTGLCEGNSSGPVNGVPLVPWALIHYKDVILPV